VAQASRELEGLFACARVLMSACSQPQGSMRKPGEVNLQETNLKIAAENKALREAKADIEAKCKEVLDEYDSLRKAYDTLDERWAQTLYPALSKL
jgi:hypothetical protein